MKLKKIEQQTIVITGASSGIGLVTARMAAKKGARVVLAARSEEALQQLTDEINSAGGDALSVVADVGKEQEVQNIADAAIQRFGGFDTWVNNAGVTIYGNLMEVSVSDMRRLFETNFWGVVHGSIIAARHLRERGGALINIGSTLSDRAIPLQGIYCASKHALKGFTDALRMELESDGAPVCVSLIKPAAIDTPYGQHAKNYMRVAPKNIAPVYAPEVVAKTILYCATHPTRDAFAGFGGKALSLSGNYLPRMTDKWMEHSMIQKQQSDQPSIDHPNGLHQASGELHERGDHDGHVAESSLYTKASLHPVLTSAVMVGMGLAAAALWPSKYHEKSNGAFASPSPRQKVKQVPADQTKRPRSVSAG